MNAAMLLPYAAMEEVMGTDRIDLLLQDEQLWLSRIHSHPYSVVYDLISRLADLRAALADAQRDSERLREALKELVLEVESYRRCHGKLPVYQEQVDRAYAAMKEAKPCQP